MSTPTPQLVAIVANLKKRSASLRQVCLAMPAWAFTLFNPVRTLACRFRGPRP